MDAIYIAAICAGGVLFCALAALFVWFSNNKIGVTKYGVKSEKIPQSGVRAVLLSDLHGKRFNKNNAKLFALVKEQKPDFIAFTGDIIHKYRARDILVAREAIEGLIKIAPVYYVSGNHEMRDKRYRALKKLIEGAGATVLEGECVEAFGLDICGVNCAAIKAGKFFNLADGERFSLLLAHLPHYFLRYAAAGYDGVFCGHAHGGQWRLPFTKIGIYSPGQGLFPKYVSGVHRCGNTQMVISRGLGNSECPLRLFNRPEIVVVNMSR